MPEFERVSFTYASGDALLEMISRQRRTGERFEIGLNSADFEALVNVLDAVHSSRDDSLGEWAGAYLADMAEMLNVEFI